MIGMVKTRNTSGFKMFTRPGPKIKVR